MELLLAGVVGVVVFCLVVLLGFPEPSFLELGYTLPPDDEPAQLPPRR